MENDIYIIYYRSPKWGNYTNMDVHGLDTVKDLLRADGQRNKRKIFKIIECSSGMNIFKNLIIDLIIDEAEGGMR